MAVQTQETGIEQLLSGVYGLIEGDEHFIPKGVEPGEQVTAFAPNEAWTELIVGVGILRRHRGGLRPQLMALFETVERLEIALDSLEIQMTDVGLELALTRPVERWEELVAAAEDCGVRY